MTVAPAPDALAIAARAWQAGCFAEFGARILARAARREKLAAREKDSVKPTRRVTRGIQA